MGAAYGRQLANGNAGLLEAHARIFNYPLASRVKTMADAPELGIKTAFMSDSFAAYRLKALDSVGGFPLNTVFGEDTYVAAKMLLQGWKVAYQADARVYHSHSYSPVGEFKRYFDIGVLHAREPWIRERFGQTEGEGLRFVRSELKFLRKRNPMLIPSAILRTALKLMGYKLGGMERRVPIFLKRRLSANRKYWCQ